MNAVVECKNNYRCWECEKNCQIKDLFLLPEELFISILHDSYSSNIGFMMAHGISMKDAEKIQNIKTLSLITARKKFLEEKT